ncbi:MAG: TolC family protein [Cytophagales bacterium]|nr:MAG: TolC family protein [Cytophagales bacterium]
MVIFQVLSLAKPHLLFAQTAVLDAYVKEGLQNNQALKQQRFLLEKSLYALKEANTLFMPTVNFNTTYTSATGGRRLSFPIGDLVNPVYQTLNQLTQTDRFPKIENTNEQLMPRDFYDAKFRVSVPLVNAEIYYNKKIKQEQITMQQAEINVYKRELVKDVKMAYFKYMQATEAIKIYQNALNLLKESQRINQSLVNNGMAISTVLLRSQSEIGKIEAQIMEAKNNSQNAAAYLNFLLNKPLENQIQIDTAFNTIKTNVPESIGSEMGNREELQKIKAGISANQQIVNLNKVFWLPKLGTSVDLGSQGFHWQFNDQTRYALLGVSLDWNLFASGRNKLKIKQAEMDLNALNTQYEQADSQLHLQVRTTVNNYLSALEIYQSTQVQVDAAQKYFNDTFKRYKQGQATQIEYLDARNNLTSAQLQQSIALYNVWIRLAEVERVKASYSFSD